MISVFVEEWFEYLLSEYYIIIVMNIQVYFALKIHEMRWHFGLYIAVLEENEGFL